MNSHWTSHIGFSHRQGNATPRPKEPGSPYFGVPEQERQHVTLDLLRNQPLDGPSLRDAALESWDDIFQSKLGPARIGVHIKPAAQIMGFFLHELIPLRLSSGSTDWRRDSNSQEKDLVYVPDPSMSIEIKTSSHKDQVFGNRSFGQQSAGRGKKAKSGYYCTVNFQRWQDALTRPEVTVIRYGWLDSTDWVAQTAQTGQNSTLPASVYNTQLGVLYENY